MPTALLFPGQGAQHVGMGGDLWRHSAAARAVIQEAEDVSRLPLRRLCAEGPTDALRATRAAQPAIVAVELSVLAAASEALGLDPTAPADLLPVLEIRYVAGHSLGEYTAFAAAGALSIADTLKLAAERGALMADAADGAMAAVIGLETERVAELCAAVGCDVVVANDNAPGQVVISGRRAAVSAAGEAARTAGARRVIPLDVGGGFHSPLMAAPASIFAAVVDSVALRPPRVPVIANTTAEPIHTAGEGRAELRRQMTGPVRWRETLLRLVADGIDSAWECGPGDVLSGLARRAAPDLRVERLGAVDDVARVAASIRARR